MSNDNNLKMPIWDLIRVTLFGKQYFYTFMLPLMAVYCLLAYVVYPESIELNSLVAITSFWVSLIILNLIHGPKLLYMAELFKAKSGIQLEVRIKLIKKWPFIERGIFFDNLPMSETQIILKLIPMKHSYADTGISEDQWNHLIKTYNITSEFLIKEFKISKELADMIIASRFRIAQDLLYALADKFELTVTHVDALMINFPMSADKTDYDIDKQAPKAKTPRKKPTKLEVDGSIAPTDS